MRDPYNSGADLDARLEKVIETHVAETTKASSTPDQEEPISGLQSFVERRSISEEIADITPEKIAHVDLHEELARDQIDGIIADRRSKLSAFHEAVKSAAAEETAADPVKVASDLIRQGVDPKEAARRALA